MGVGRILGGDVHLVLDAGERTQLGLDDDAVVMGILHDLARDLDVLLEGLGGRVDHDGGETVLDAGLARLKAVAVVEVQHDRQTRLNVGRLDELFQIGAVRVGARTLGHLQDQRRLQLSRRLRDALDDLHIVDVEGADGVAAVIGLFEHFRRCNQCHNISLLFMTDQWAGSLFYAIL